MYISVNAIFSHKMICNIVNAIFLHKIIICNSVISINFLHFRDFIFHVHMMRTHEIFITIICTCQYTDLV